MNTSKMTPRKAIRARCLDCSGGHYGQISNCEISDCPLWPYRMGLAPQHCLALIRENCIDCCGGNIREASLCPATGCPLHQYRNGHNPKRKGVGNKNPNGSSYVKTTALS